MKQSLPSPFAALLCGPAWALAALTAGFAAAVWGADPARYESSGGLLAGDPGRSASTAAEPARRELHAATPAATAPSMLDVPALDVPARRPPYPSSRFSTESGSSPMFGPYGIVPATHAEAASEGPPPPPPAPPPAATLLADSIRSLASRRSISAKTRQGAKLFGRELVGSGTFAQGPASSRLVRYDLQLLLKSRVVSLLQVSDGRYLWLVEDLKGEPDIERIEVDRLVAAESAEMEAAGAGAAPRELALGGVSRLMTSLENSFDFSAVARSQLGNVAVFVVEGAWKPEILARALPDQFVKVSQGQGGYDTSALRSHVPDRVALYIGADDLFPYRIEYRRTGGSGSVASGSATPTGSASAGTASGPAAAYDVLAYVDFFEVRFDVLLDGSLFTFDPGARPYIDVTESYLAKQKK